MTATIADRLGAGDLPVVDCDLHVHPPADALREHLPERFRGKGVSYPDGNWASPVGRFREDVDPGDPAALAAGHLDPLGIEHAVVTGAEPVLRAGVQPDRRYAAALTGAYNDWLLDALPDDRLHASIAVAPIAPEEAAAEIRRLGDHPDVVQVVVGGATSIALGEERYWPIYEAAVEHDRPVAIHGGEEG